MVSFGEKLKAHSEILDFQIFSDISFLSRKMVKCVEMEIADFYDFSSEVRNRKNQSSCHITSPERCFTRTRFLTKNMFPVTFCSLNAMLSCSPTARNVERHQLQEEE